MDVSFYAHSPTADDYVHLTKFFRIHEPTERKINLAKFELMKDICRSPSLIGRITFRVDLFDDDDHRFAHVIADWRERLKVPS